nr:nucleotidyltransferase domain-containing protein [Erwinia sp. Ejp617]
MIFAEIDLLLVQKKQAAEAEYGPRRERIHAFILQQLEQQSRPPLQDAVRRDSQLLDRMLMQTVLTPG